MAETSWLDQLELQCVPTPLTHAKISSKSASNRYIRINNTIHADLKWAVNHLQCDTGIYLIHWIWWDISSADFTILWCLPGRMGFYISDKSIGFYCPILDRLTDEQIFYFKVLCVLSSIHHLVEAWQPLQSSHLLIYMDNDNTVAIFSTLWCLQSTTISLLVLLTPSSTKNSIYECYTYQPCCRHHFLEEFWPCTIIHPWINHIPHFTPSFHTGAAQKWSPPMCSPDSPLGRFGHMNTSSMNMPLLSERPSITWLGRIMDLPWTLTLTSW